MRRIPFRAWVWLFVVYAYCATTVSAAWFLRRDYGVDLATSLRWAGGLYAPCLITGLAVWVVLRRFGSEGRAVVLLSALAVPAVALIVVSGVLIDGSMRGQDWSAAEILSRGVDRLPVAILLYTAVAATGLAASHWRGVLKSREELRAVRTALAEARRTRSEDASPTERLMVAVGRRRTPVCAEEVEWIAAAGNYAVVHWGDREGLIRETLQALETRLAPHGFARSHRSTLVNLARVRDLRPLPDGAWRLTLDGGAELVVSRTYRDGFLARLGRASPSP